VRILLEVGGADPCLPNTRGVAPYDLLAGRGRAYLRILPSYWPVRRLLEVRCWLGLGWLFHWGGCGRLYRLVDWVESLVRQCCGDPPARPPTHPLCFGS
jgi:hypothetical protein